MNKSQLVEAVASDAGISKADAARAVQALTDNVEREVKKGNRVTLPGFGTFERRSRKARTARNPQTGAAIRVKAAKVPAFKPGQTFKDVVSGKAKAPAAPKKTAAAKKPAAKKATTAKKAPARKPAAKKTTRKR